MVIQAYFRTLNDLEFSASRNESISCTAEAMSVRRFEVPDPALKSESYCTYLVAYEGRTRTGGLARATSPPSADHGAAARSPLAWRCICRAQWRCPAGWRRVRSLQRNKVAFDSAEALAAALNSPVRKEMRADYAALPKFWLRHALSDGDAGDPGRRDMTRLLRQHRTLTPRRAPSGRKSRYPLFGLGEGWRSRCARAGWSCCRSSSRRGERSRSGRLTSRLRSCMTTTAAGAARLRHRA